jgi:predicted nuclease of predicted toxin-antitoxin system
VSTGPAAAPTLVLLDTNAYLRLAKRVRPLLGVPFGQKRYVLTLLEDVEEEVRRNPRLRFHYPWFDGDEALASERISKRLKLPQEERAQLDAAARFLHDWVLQDAQRFTTAGRSPPGPTDCRVLAFSQVCATIVVTDDLGMHELAREFSLPVWHGFELLAKMRTAKVVSDELVREIYAALEANGDLTATWRDAKHKALAKVFGPPPR